MTAPEAGRSSHELIHAAYFREVLQDIRKVMAANYGLSRTSIRPIRSEASHLSIPVKISGSYRTGGTRRYFGKILGRNDILSDRSMQFVKNLYLQMNSQDPIFGFTETAEDMARQQFESQQAIFRAGIPTAKPLGFHSINEDMWLIVTEFLESRPVSECDEITVEQIDTLFRHLKKLHSSGIFHGDIKAGNIMLGDKIYILDVGVFRDHVRRSEKQAYDLSCLICSFIDCHPLEATVKNARKYYTRGELLEAAKYIDLIQQRQDFHFSNRQKAAVKAALAG
ncbi:MAG: hypothetical protein ACYDFT_00710 [Thermoplasmata archaeon]